MFQEAIFSFMLTGLRLACHRLEEKGGAFHSAEKEGLFPDCAPAIQKRRAFFSSFADEQKKALAPGAWCEGRPSVRHARDHRGKGNRGKPLA
jgi:hypothetical protein